MSDTRDAALMLAETLIRTGHPIHPRRHEQIREAIGELTPEESERLQIAGRLRIVEAREREQDMKRLAEFAARFRERFGLA
jgi:hypothetical protein